MNNECSKLRIFNWFSLKCKHLMLLNTYLVIDVELYWQIKKYFATIILYVKYKLQIITDQCTIMLCIILYYVVNCVLNYSKY